jgi:hypothetical protein
MDSIAVVRKLPLAVGETHVLIPMPFGCAIVSAGGLSRAG